VPSAIAPRFNSRTTRSETTACASGLSWTVCAGNAAAIRPRVQPAGAASETRAALPARPTPTAGRKKLPARGVSRSGWRRHTGDFLRNAGVRSRRKHRTGYRVQKGRRLRHLRGWRCVESKCRVRCATHPDCGALGSCSGHGSMDRDSQFSFARTTASREAAGSTARHAPPARNATKRPDSRAWAPEPEIWIRTAPARAAARTRIALLATNAP
jgi:hypothetical protein